MGAYSVACYLLDSLSSSPRFEHWPVPLFCVHLNTLHSWTAWLITQNINVLTSWLLKAKVTNVGKYPAMDSASYVGQWYILACWSSGYRLGKCCYMYFMHWKDRDCSHFTFDCNLRWPLYTNPYLMIVVITFSTAFHFWTMWIWKDMSIVNFTIWPSSTAIPGAGTEHLSFHNRLDHSGRYIHSLVHVLHYHKEF